MKGVSGRLAVALFLTAALSFPALAADREARPPRLIDRILALLHLPVRSLDQLSIPPG
jgi:hypothetical protein